MLTAGTVNHIKYTDSKGDTSEREVVPLRPIPTSCNTIDVTDLDDDARDQVIEMIEEYNDYQDSLRAASFSFEDFVEHMHGTRPDVKWRRFNLDRIELLD